MQPPRVVLHPLHPHGVDKALMAMPGINLECPEDNEGVASALRDGAEVLVTFTWRDEFLTPSLRWVAGTGAGAEQYPHELFEKCGVTLTTAVGVHSITVAEHAFALVLAMTRRIGEAVRHMAEPTWVPMLADEISGKKMAIVGLGRIGEEIARRALAWDIEVAGVKRRPENYTGCLENVHGPAELQDLCAWADILVIAAPANEDGSPLVGAKELELLGAGWLVNVGRGTLVDGDALCSAVIEGELRGAGLDVTTPEPLPADSPLWSSPKVVLTAHYAGASPYYGERWGKIFSHNLKAFREGGPWENRLVPKD
ncbi:hypothetical protein C2I36_05090 [Rhodobacteraceae bacterium WD3A24]|nr:hypothetical protein C2I36_05090 [Rhodobacteraceae bacterium WD3A24]